MLVTGAYLKKSDKIIEAKNAFRHTQAFGFLFWVYFCMSLFIKNLSIVYA